MMKYSRDFHAFYILPLIMRGSKIKRFCDLLLSPKVEVWLTPALEKKLNAGGFCPGKIFLLVIGNLRESFAWAVFWLPHSKFASINIGPETVKEYRSASVSASPARTARASTPNPSATFT